MFTGIIQAVGLVRALEATGGDWRLSLEAGSLDLTDLQLGDSVAVSGPCLTVAERNAEGFAVDVSAETWSRTAFRDLGPGSRVNLEKALLPTSRIGGHFVTGHVDGVAVLKQRKVEARSERFALELPGRLCRYLAEKGAVALDGVSLTVNEVAGCWFEVNVIPYTLAHTNLADRQVGDWLNVEVDLLARYLERFLGDRGFPGSGTTRMPSTPNP